MKIEIKHKYKYNVLFAFECENNSIKITLEAAIKSRANLYGANLSRADLSSANLSGANLSEAKNTESLSRTMIVPEEGDFIGFKKICTSEGKKVIKVLIPSEAKRVGGAAGRKCRAEFVTMLEDVDGWSDHNSGFKYSYKAGETVYPDKFDDRITEECTHGIHFFITKQEAIDY